MITPFPGGFVFRILHSVYMRFSIFLHLKLKEWNEFFHQYWLLNIQNLFYSTSILETYEAPLTLWQDYSKYIYIYIYIYMCVCVYLRKTGNKSDNMKIFRDEKTQGLKRMIEFVEIFANIKRFAFFDFHQGV